MQMHDILDRLIAFDTVSDRTNLPLVQFVRDLLAQAGIAAELIPDATGAKANLVAVTGPRDAAGVVLSGHVDVVPVEGQAWTRPPFRLTAEGGRLYGRGTTDMKGFVACAIAAMLEAARRPLRAPLILALSHDEEVGCRGVGSLIDRLPALAARPRLVLVGEPTGLRACVGHKGKVALRADCTGRAMHSSCAPLAVNAIHLAVDVVGAIRDLQAGIAAAGPFDADYEVPYTTLHAGRIRGGVQVNIVADSAVVDFEIRSLAQDDPAPRIAALAARAEAIAARHRALAPEAAITITRDWDYPGLATPPDDPAVALVQGLSGDNRPPFKVTYGTEGGLFQTRLGLPTVVCGPGHMAQGHTPDEFIEAAELARCQAMLARLTAGLEAA